MSDMTPQELTAVLDGTNAASILSSIAAEVKRLHPGVDEEKLSAALADRSACHTTLRGPLLIMEAACNGLDEPCVFHIFRTTDKVPWHGAAVKLWLACLYRDDDLGRYLVASSKVLRQVSTGQYIRKMADDSA
jgi:hypothetical protein